MLTRHKLLLLSMLLGLAQAAHSAALNIVFTHHSSASNPFWQAVKKGYDDACKKVDANCQMIFTQKEGSVEQQASNMQAAIARKPDALITSIVDNKAFDKIIEEARAKGIIVLAANVDDTEGAKGNARQAFIGQSFHAAGMALGQAISEKFPKSVPIKALVGVSAPGQNWSESRAAGVMDFLKSYKAAHPDQKISWDRMDSGADLALTTERVNAKLRADPEINVYFDTGLWHYGVARALADRGIPPGKILLGGFDLVPEVLTQMSAGYIQAEVDQQPYMQGFMPVMQVYLTKNFGLIPADINTGKGIVFPEDVPAIKKLSEQGLR